MRLPLLPWSMPGVPSSHPGYLITAPPSVCVPAVICALTVWIQNQKKKVGSVSPKKERKTERIPMVWWHHKPKTRMCSQFPMFSGGLAVCLLHKQTLLCASFVCVLNFFGTYSLLSTLYHLHNISISDTYTLTILHNHPFPKSATIIHHFRITCIFIQEATAIMNEPQVGCMLF